MAAMSYRWAGVRGRVSEDLTIRHTKGKPHLIKVANMSRVKWSVAQIRNRARWAEAHAYAKAVLEDATRKLAFQQSVFFKKWHRKRKMIPHRQLVKAFMTYQSAW